MHVFKKSRKAKDKENVDPFGQDSNAKMSRSQKRKNKNAPPPTKPVFDLNNALPDTNDFRTSLLMPGLSARFSMLKEQDDPKTLIGKASDDSVLFPKRASRMNLFSHNPLTDIAETESLHSIPKPFAQAERSMSMSEGGYASDDGGSIIGRSRPLEGNAFFGGKQKVYRVANGTATTSGKGRYVYDDDAHSTLYPKQSKEDADKVDGSDGMMRRSEEADLVSSPMTAFSKNRGTQSSTNSGPSGRRTSTAATSVATCESPLPRHNSGHNSSKLASDGFEGTAVTRNTSADSRKNYNSASQPPVPSPSPRPNRLSQSKSAVNLNDKYSARGPVFATSTFRPASPSPAPQPTVTSDDASKNALMHARRYQTASPTNQFFDEEGDQVYSNNLQPNDRGKATAMGLFNRPRQQFDEQQFLQRQKQMHEGRASPLPRNGDVDRVASPAFRSFFSKQRDAALEANSAQANQARESQDSYQSRSTEPSQAPSSRSFTPSEATNGYVGRLRGQSSASGTSGPADVKARVNSLIKRQNAELVALEGERQPTLEHHRKSSISTDKASQPRSTFINRFDSSDDEEDQETEVGMPKLNPEEVHPALRDGLQDFDFGEEVSPRLPLAQSTGQRESPVVAVKPQLSPAKSQKSAGNDSPTLGPNGLGLSGMIRTHLRHDSDRSSVYPGSPTSRHMSRTSREMSMVSTAATVNPPESVHSDPWEYDNTQRHQRKDSGEARPTMSQKAAQILGHAAAQRPGTSKAQQVLGSEAPRPSNDSARTPKLPQEPTPSRDVESRPWQNEQQAESQEWQSEQAAHRRNASTETQKERQAFDEELAERRRKIQEGLKGVSERDRPASPAYGRVSHEQNGPAFPSLRHKTSRGHMAAAEYSNKAMKMLGLHSQPAPEHHHQQQRPPFRHQTSSDTEYDEPPRERYYRQPQNRPPPAPSNSYGRRPPHDLGRRTPVDGRTTPAGYANSSNEDFDRPRQQRSYTPVSQQHYHPRDRAMSDVHDAPRTKSRNRGHYPPPQHHDGYSPPHHYQQGQQQQQQPPYQRSQHSNSPSPPHQRRSPPRHGQYHNPPPVQPPPMMGNAAGYERPPSTTPGGGSGGSGRQRSNSRPTYYEGGHSSNPGMAQQQHSPAIPAARPSPRLQQGPINSPMPPPQQLQSTQSPYLHPASSTTDPSASTIHYPSPALSSTGHAFPPLSPLPPPTGELPAPPASGPAPGPTGRRRTATLNKSMISDPVFISSTSTLPLVGLPVSPRPNGGDSVLTRPELPIMNPRRRASPANGGGGTDVGPAGLSVPPSLAGGGYGGSVSAQPSPTGYGAVATSFESMLASGGNGGGGSVKAGAGGAPPPVVKARNRLRKISSEGGNMAGRARLAALVGGGGGAAAAAGEGQAKARWPVDGYDGLERRGSSAAAVGGGGGRVDGAMF